MRKIVLVSIILLVVALAPAFSQNATITQITGKVQLLAPGGSWVDAKVGAVVSPLTVVATGFNSTAVLNLGTSQLQVKQLTRMRVIELLRNQSSATTALFLTVGAVHANVDNNLGITQKYSIQSPVSTAAVRGTIFDFDGYSCTVDRGIVHFSTPAGFGREITVGQTSVLTSPYVPGSAEEFEQAQSQTKVNTNPTGGGTTNLPGIGITTGSVTVTIK